MEKTLVHVLETDELHRPAVLLGDHAYKCVLRVAPLQLGHDADLGANAEGVWLGKGGGTLEDRCCGAEEDPRIVLVVSLTGDGGLGVDQQLRVGILLEELLHGDAIDHLVDHAVAVPDLHLAPGLGADVVAEVTVGAEEYRAVLRELADDVEGIGGGDAVVGLRLDVSGGIDIADHKSVGVLLLPLPQVRALDRRGEGAAGVADRQEDLLIRRDDRGGLSHKLHSAEDDHLRIGPSRLLRELERVAEQVRGALHLCRLVEV